MFKLELETGKFEFQNWNWNLKISSFKLEFDTRFSIFLNAFPRFVGKVDSSSTLFYDFGRVCMSGCAKDYLIVQNFQSSKSARLVTIPLIPLISQDQPEVIAPGGRKK